jgi:hypothetical protein
MRKTTVSSLFGVTGQWKVSKLFKDAATVPRYITQMSSVIWCNVK